MECIPFILVTEITKLAMCMLFFAPSPPSCDVAPSVSSLCNMSLSFQFSVTLAVLQNPSPLTANINSTFHEFSMCLSCKCCLWLTLDTLQVHCFVLLSVLVLASKSSWPNDLEKPFKISTSALYYILLDAEYPSVLGVPVLSSSLQSFLSTCTHSVPLSWFLLLYAYLMWTGRSRCVTVFHILKTFLQVNI